MRHVLQLFLDWKGVFHHFRPKAPRTTGWPREPGLASAVTARLADVLATALPQSSEWLVNVAAYGGFRDTGGQATAEAETLLSGLAIQPWGRRVRPHLLLGEFNVVDCLLPDGRFPLRGLARPTEELGAAFLSPTSACDCNWRQATQQWLAQLPPRHCPACGHDSPTELCQRQQKLVDALLMTHAIAAGHRLLANPDLLRSEEIWVCSPDADFVPVLGLLATLGVPCVWLQPFPNRRYGYAEQLTELGVRVLSASTPEEIHASC